MARPSARMKAVTASSDVHALTAAELAHAFGSAELSPVEVAEALLRRIDAVDPSINAFCFLDPDETLSQARASEQRRVAGEQLSPLDGIPVAVKDLFFTSGWPTLKGSRLVSRDQAWTEDAPAVARLREAGAVLVGKTTTPEFGWKGLTDSPLTGITRNPWDTSRTPGGSSGGSAAALAAGLAPLALGTDGGGSIRIPGAFTGTAGLKPTFGRVPYAPMSPFGTVAHAGPMARTVHDLAMLLDVVARYDVRDWTALPSGTGSTLDQLDGGVQGLQVMFSPGLGFAEVEPEIAELVTTAVGVLEGLGARVTVADPGIDDPIPIWETLWYAGASAVVADLESARLDEVDPGLLEIAEEGARLSALKYVQAVQARIDVALTLGRSLADYDLLLTPTVPLAAFDAGTEVPPGWPHRRWQTWSPFSIPFNLSQQPAATVPCGLTGEGLPAGLQIVGGKHRDAVVLRAAAAYEAARATGNDTFVRPLTVVR